MEALSGVRIRYVIHITYYIIRKVYNVSAGDEKIEPGRRGLRAENGAKYGRAKRRSGYSTPATTKLYEKRKEIAKESLTSQVANKNRRLGLIRD